MCYYDSFKYACNCWKWGNFRSHCQKEYRTGETCGIKLVNTTIFLPDKCGFCEKIEKKLRRIEKARSDILRWRQEPNKYRASLEKAIDDIRQLEGDIRRITAEKDQKLNQIGNTRRKAAAV